ncbi:unnamed protein product [Closterium sp. Yama58-4]|nr:unnamed protein product [Closterium sp. Yama58-4]
MRSLSPSEAPDRQIRISAPRRLRRHDAAIDVEEDEEEEELPFRWGDPAPGPSRGGKRYYLWFEQGGERFDLYDCVYCQAEEGMDPYVGKIVRMYELPPSRRGKRSSIGGGGGGKPGERKVDIRWFFRAADVQAEGGQLPRDVRPNEVFLAVPEGTQGVTDANKVIVVDSRAHILCVSADPRNPQPSAAQVEAAELVFRRAWDMQQKRVIEDLQVAIDDLGSEEAVFNKPTWVQQQQPTSGAIAGEKEEEKEEKEGAPGKEAGDGAKGNVGAVREEKDGALRIDTDVKGGETGMGEGKGGESGGGEQKRLSKRMKVEDQVGEKGGKQRMEKKTGDPWDLEEEEEEEEEEEVEEGQEDEQVYEEEDVEEEEGEDGEEEEGVGLRKEGQAGTDGTRQGFPQGLPQGLQPAAAPDGPGIIEGALEEQRVMRIDNIPPCTSSQQLHEAMLELFSDVVAVRPTLSPILVKIQILPSLITLCSHLTLILHTPPATCSPLIGRLQRPPAVAPSPVDAPSASLVSHGPGYFTIRNKRGGPGQYSDDKKNSLTTSHCAQPNVVEYELGVEWRAVQQREVYMVKALLKVHQAELNSLMQSIRD